MTQLPPLEHINALTTQGIAFLDTLNSLLDQEYEALQQRNIEQLQELVEQKTEALQQLEENNQVRNQLFISAGITPDKAGLQAFQAELDEADAKTFSTLWNQLEKVLLQVNDKNKRNELIITRNSRNLEQLLSILRGQNQKNTLYDQSGEKGNYSAQNSLGKA
ncbi:flagella synthesis protein FlgN [Amphritea japonica]|uniref:Flagella synthesis protein FlgN n=1 Tax=Amphritea japonica ATCC BAA-1530 TaxID=1278309 RepID=A0A7R6PKF7_9GAMM|nr:flagellar protein FlgN [Amphritea japonica]BBB25138.1 flagella synthesis protein FlgN [Amphritea japonica ATCC BAA-1530]